MFLPSSETYFSLLCFNRNMMQLLGMLLLQQIGQELWTLRSLTWNQGLLSWFLSKRLNLVHGLSSSHFLGKCGA